MSMDDTIPAAKVLTDSQFLPNTRTQFAWDSVSLTSILSCPRRYFYSIIEGYQPRGPSHAIALTFGIAMHSALESFHRHRVTLPYDEAIEACVADTLADSYTLALPTGEEAFELDGADPTERSDDFEDDGIYSRNAKVRTRYHLIRALVWYLEHYREDNLITYLLPSGAPAVELSFRTPLPFEIGDNPAILCGHIDRVVKFNDSTYVTDYKTTKSLTSQWKDMFDLSHQMTGYQIGGQTILPDPVKGVWIDGIALLVGGVKFGRHNTRRTPGQIAEYFNLVKYAADQSRRFDEEDNYPLNTAACYFCEYKAVCRQPPEYRQQQLSLLFEKGKSWNPLANR